MRRLNVREAQIDECIQKSMFALKGRPQNPELYQGELLLLQLVKNDASHLGKLKERINFALVFDHLERDYDGTISRRHWPTENRVWPWILYGSATVPTIPFSLEDLPLSVSDAYHGQANPRYIAPQDEQLIRPYIRWSLAEQPAPYLEIIPTAKVVQRFGQQRALSAIYNHDRIAALKPIPKQTITVEEFVRNKWLAESLKVYYEHRCQICGKSFLPDYGVQLADTHHIHYLAQGGPDVSTNIVVLCPNHHRVIHATDANFDRHNLTYDYPNGLREKLVLPDHLIYSPSATYTI
jgi:5-methylcytosine-specific restriction endonuclease McrA